MEWQLVGAALQTNPLTNSPCVEWTWRSAGGVRLTLSAPWDSCASMDWTLLEWPMTWPEMVRKMGAELIRLSARLEVGIQVPMDIEEPSQAPTPQPPVDRHGNRRRATKKEGSEG